MGRLKKQVILIAVALMMICWGGRYFEALGAEINLRLAGSLPLEHHGTKVQNLLAKLVEERTEGRVKITVFPASTLFSDKEMFRVIPTGAADIGLVNNMWSGLVPSVMVTDFPYVFKDRRHVWRTVDGEAGKMVGEILEKEAGVKILFWSDYGEIEFITKKSVKSLEDFKGMMIRTYGEMSVAAVKALGAAPAFLGGGEVYMALQRGTVDGALSGPTSFWERKFYEVTKYIPISNYGFVINPVVMNLKKWNELSQDIQNKILTCSKEAQEQSRMECEKEDNRTKELLRQRGMEITPLAPAERERWRKATYQPAMDLFLTRVEKGKAIRLIELIEKAR